LNKRLTETPIPICSYTNTLPPATDTNGNVIAYTKPIVVLNNNFTLSAAETFAATLQDAERATMFGTQTDGGGGNVVSFNATAFSEGNTRVTESLEIRNHLISTTDLPSAPYVENIGVQPDLFSDYQTRANLLTGGQPFVEGFTIAIAKLIELGHP
jgi:C-terminal processing protease CtpA/Prc